MFESSNDKPGVEETYQVAGNTSDLTVEADRRGAGDVLIAAGWSPSRVGMALLRLHSEWDSAAKPKRMALDQVKALAASMPDKKGKPNMARAKAEAERGYASDLRMLANNLKSRPVVWLQLTHWLTLKGVHPDTVAAALLHWLNPSCPVCNGQGLRKVPDQPALSARQCHKCHGTGHLPHPEGSARVLSYFDDCVSKARFSLKGRLRSGN